QSPQNERLILSEKATIINDGGELKLNLNQGRAYELLAEKLHEVAFKTMLIFTFPTDTVDDVESLWDYWADMDKDHKKAKNFSLYTLISLFPLATVLFSLSMGIVTYRYQRGGIYGAIFVILFAYFASIMLISKNIPIYGIGFVFGLFFLLSLVIFRQKILKRF
ncbi:MAG: hypothetical protein GX780_07820, partial [Campylobacteraceae bacterium]|nr:hypothetical protein [Campylobacteraceae bacterium]